MKITTYSRIVLCLPLSLLFLLKAEAGGEPRSYSLSRGSSLPVCRAFLDVLNSMKGDEAPLCNQSEPTAAPGFSALHRKRLSSDELYTVSESLIGFAEHGDSAYFDKRRASLTSWCEAPANAAACRRILARKKQTTANGGRWLETYSREFFRTATAWRYEPEIDVDNDGTVDPILLLTRDRCGGENLKGLVEASPTFAFIMNRDYRAVDEDRTSQVFGHPIREWPAGLESERFRYIGTNLGIFVYERSTYFYTLLTSFSDFSGERVADESLSSTLGVFEHKSGRMSDVCEYLRGK